MAAVESRAWSPSLAARAAGRALRAAAMSPPMTCASTSVAAAQNSSSPAAVGMAVSLGRDAARDGG